VTAPSIGSYFNSTGIITTQVPFGVIYEPDGTIPDAILVVSSSIYGNVYKDANHNANFESTETGTGLTLFAKLIRPVDPLNPQPAVVAVSVNGATGAYEFTGLNGALMVGNYTIIIDDNSTLTDTTPVAQPIAPGWIATEEPTLTRVVTVPINEKASFFNDFGLFLGSKLTGRVFVDAGVGTGGIANDGLQNGTETGLPGVTMKATHATLCPPTPPGACDSTVTDGKGDYILWISSTVTGSVSVVETNLSAYLSTGGRVGNTVGIYTLATDTTTFTPGASTFYTGVNFADVPVNNFAPNDQGVGLPGTAIFYPHTFSAGTAGSLVFTSANVPSPNIPGWSHLIFRDENCNGALDPAGLPPTPIPELPITGPIVVTAGQDVCIIVKEYLPFLDGAQDVITVTATFTYVGCALCLPTVQTVTDTSLVGQTDLFLKKQICEDTSLDPPPCDTPVTKSTNQMPPGSEVVYRITYTNVSASPLNNVMVKDMIPSFTKFKTGSATCATPLPPNITLCTPSTPPPLGTGPISWTLTGVLQPGASSYVEFTVIID
jgi:uncharacterized repeat protein (TIGR01451 family)